MSNLKRERGREKKEKDSERDRNRAKARERKNERKNLAYLLTKKHATKTINNMPTSLISLGPLLTLNLAQLITLLIYSL